jgi:drug/metabolite transporter (DMT)-like permease
MWKWVIFAALLVAHVVLCAVEDPATQMSPAKALCLVAAFLWGGTGCRSDRRVR